MHTILIRGAIYGAMLAVLFGGTVLYAQDVSRLLTAPPAPVAVGEEIELTVIFLNGGDRAASVETPIELSAAVVAGERRMDVTLQRTGVTPAMRQIAPGGFLRQSYRMRVPAGASGRIIIELADTAAVASIKPPSDAAPRLSPAHDSPDAVAQTERSGFVEYFREHFFPHEPIYFLVGTEQPNAKFQVSFKYQIFNEEGSLRRAFEPLGGLHLAYSQTSFWDWEEDSAPFYDNSYRPEVLWSRDHILPNNWRIPGVARVGFQAGLQHESNGQDGDDSRNINLAYVRPIFLIGDENDLFLSIAPRLYRYIGELEGNTDIAEYRGYGDIRLTIGWDAGLQLSALGRVGNEWDKGSLQLDLTYPLRQRLSGNVDLYLHAQYFTGYGESLLNYDESDNAFRIGISLVR